MVYQSEYIVEILLIQFLVTTQIKLWSILITGIGTGLICTFLHVLLRLLLRKSSGDDQYDSNLVQETQTLATVLRILLLCMISCYLVVGIVMLAFKCFCHVVTALVMVR